MGKLSRRQIDDIMPPTYERGTCWFWCGFHWPWRRRDSFFCLHNILWTSDWTLTKFSWTYNWDITKNSIDFGDLDLIFKVKAIEKPKIHGLGKSVFSENTVTSFSYLSQKVGPMYYRSWTCTKCLSCGSTWEITHCNPPLKHFWKGRMLTVLSTSLRKTFFAWPFVLNEKRILADYIYP